MKNKIFGIVVGIEEQREAFKQHCLGDCGKAFFAAAIDEQLGEVGICSEISCPYLDKEMDNAIGEIQGDALYLRKLKI